MRTPKQTYEDFAIDLAASHFTNSYNDSVSCAIMECERHIIYAEDKEYFKEVLKFLNQM